MFYLQYIWAKAAPGNKQEACRRWCASLSPPIFLSISLAPSFSAIFDTDVLINAPH